MQGQKIKRPHIVEERIAEISGIHALYPENDLKDLLVRNLDENLQVFKGKDIDLLSFDDLRHWTKWISNIENILERAITAVTLGNDLLSRSNLEPFSQILTKRDDLTLFRSYLKGLPG